MSTNMISGSQQPLLLEITNSAILFQIAGSDDNNLRYIEKQTHTCLKRRGTQILVIGAHRNQTIVKNILQTISSEIDKDSDFSHQDMISMIDNYLSHYEDTVSKSDQKTTSLKQSAINVAGKVIKPRSKRQKQYIDTLHTKPLVFSVGPAGTGKTWLAVAQAVSMLLSGGVDKIILSRPAVEAGEQLGFLPGDLKEKIDPYLQPLYDALHSMLPKEEIEKRMANGEIEIAPLAFMRGRTLSQAFIILDEAQNTTIAQMKMFLTRFGEGARMVVTGDLTQIDLQQGYSSGLYDAMSILNHVPSIGMVKFTTHDVVRHPLVAAIIEAYERRQSKTNSPIPHARDDK